MDTHLHHEEHLQSSDFLRDIVIGMSDGLTVPFALAAGLSGAVDSTNIIVIAGIAEIAAGSIAMGLGGYLAGKTEQDHYRSEVKREYYEVENLRHREIEETKEFFAGIGLSPELQEKATVEIAQDKDKWVQFMMKYELGLDEPDPKRARKSAFNIGTSYIVGGLVPLSPYFFCNAPYHRVAIFRCTHAALSFYFRLDQKQDHGHQPLGRGYPGNPYRRHGGSCCVCRGPFV